MFSLSGRKLKNRVAAQTSRDRKKARLDELEETVRTQKERNELLTQECAMLRSQNELLTSQNEWLLNENKRLRNERDAVRNTLTDQQQPICSACRTRVDSAVPSLGSAVSPNDPLPQGGTAQSALRPTRTPGATALLKFLTLYFLLKNCSAYSKALTPNDSKSWRRASYEKSVQKLKQILIDQMNKWVLRVAIDIYTITSFALHFHLVSCCIFHSEQITKNYCRSTSNYMSWYNFFSLKKCNAH